MGPSISPLQLSYGRQQRYDVSYFNSPWVVYTFLPEYNARDRLADDMTKYYGRMNDMAAETKPFLFDAFPPPGEFWVPEICFILSFWLSPSVLLITPFFERIDCKGSTFSVVQHFEWMNEWMNVRRIIGIFELCTPNNKQIIDHRIYVQQIMNWKYGKVRRSF